MSPFLLTRTLPEDATDAALRADVPHGLTHSPRTGRSLSALSSHLPLRAPTAAGKAMEVMGTMLMAIVSALSETWEVTSAAGVAISARELESRHSTDVASTEERHS
ncbi:hypothetical protein [Streptomyces sp. NBC_00344]|uniref:hypothetical protein n=1 Tax=Streptomyces sp. NBC_00344 TaxID=2975720 RepID=UPI003FA7C057